MRESSLPAPPFAWAERRRSASVSLLMAAYLNVAARVREPAEPSWATMDLGGYAIVSEIGRGGMGYVFRARSPDGRDVAIKLMFKTNSADARARFAREQRLLGS